MWILRLLPIFVTLLFILSRSVDVRVSIRKRFTIKISFNIIGIVLYETEKQKLRFIKLNKRINVAKSGLKSFRYLISKSSIALKVQANTSEGVMSSLIIHGLLLPYLNMNARSMRFKQASYGHPESFDISLRFSNIHLIISAFIFLYYLVKLRIRRIIKNV